jgi:uncharacterized protein (DUF1330 family)
MTTGKSLIQHIVCFQFNELVQPNEIDELQKTFFALQGKIPGVLLIQGGENNSPENLNKDFSHSFIITFKNEQSRKEYLPHPEHQKFVSQLKPILKDVFVMDFNVES